jgi:hypothetical protein
MGMGKCCKENEIFQKKDKRHEGQPILLYTTADQAELTGWRKYSIFLI